MKKNSKPKVHVRMKGDKATKAILNNYGAKFDERFARKLLGYAARIGVAKARNATTIGPTGNLKRAIKFQYVNKSRHPFFGGWIGVKHRKAPHQSMYAWGRSKFAPYKGEGEWIPEAAAEVSGQMTNRMMSSGVKQAKIAERAVAAQGRRAFKKFFKF